MRFWQILGLVLLVNLGVATLMFLGQGKPAQTAKPIRAGSSLGLRNMPPAQGDPYNYRFMAVSGGIMLVTAGALVLFLRRNA